MKTYYIDLIRPILSDKSETLHLEVQASSPHDVMMQVAALNAGWMTADTSRNKADWGLASLSESKRRGTNYINVLTWVHA